jgi:hypothetical protein
MQGQEGMVRVTWRQCREYEEKASRQRHNEIDLGENVRNSSNHVGKQTKTILEEFPRLVVLEVLIAHVTNVAHNAESFAYFDFIHLDDEQFQQTIHLLREVT